MAWTFCETSSASLTQLHTINPTTITVIFHKPALDLLNFDLQVAWIALSEMLDTLLLDIFSTNNK